MFTQKIIKIFHSIQEIWPFSLFIIWRSAKPRPMINVILQFLELDLVNIDMSAKFYQNIPNGLRVKFHFFRIWTSAKPWAIPNVIWLSYGEHLSISMCMQNFITIFHSFQEIGPFSLFQNWSSAKPRPMKNVISQSLGLYLVNINFSRTVRWRNLHKLSRTVREKYR